MVDRIEASLTVARRPLDGFPELHIFIRNVLPSDIDNQASTLNRVLIDVNHLRETQETYYDQNGLLPEDSKVSRRVGDLSECLL